MIDDNNNKIYWLWNTLYILKQSLWAQCSKHEFYFYNNIYKSKSERTLNMKIEEKHILICVYIYKLHYIYYIISFSNKII